jgi:hypothetical protein
LGPIGAAALAVLVFYLEPVVQENWDPPSKSVTLSDVCIESGVERGQWFHDSTGKLERLDPTLRGVVVSVNMTATGFDGKDIILTGNVLRAGDGEQAPLGSAANLGEEKVVEPKASTVERAPEVWVPLPTMAGRFVIKLYVFDGQDPSENQRLASIYSGQFIVKSDGGVELPALCTAS